MGIVDGDYRIEELFKLYEINYENLSGYNLQDETKTIEMGRTNNSENTRRTGGRRLRALQESSEIARYEA